MIEWIMNHIGLDKLKHLAYSFVISALAGIIVILFEAPIEAGIFAAIYSGVVAGVTKEFTDWMWGGEFGVKDLLFDLAGIILGAVLTFLITLG